MKTRRIIIAVLFLVLLSAGFQTVNAQQLSVISSNTVLRRGDTGTITIQGKPNTSYTINTSYVLGSREISVAQRRVSDETGQATFNWVVDRKTALGTRTAVITGAGERLELTHTVIE